MSNTTTPRIAVDDYDSCEAVGAVCEFDLDGKVTTTVRHAEPVVNSTGDGVMTFTTQAGGCINVEVRPAGEGDVVLTRFRAVFIADANNKDRYVVGRMFHSAGQGFSLLFDFASPTARELWDALLDLDNEGLSDLDKAFVEDAERSAAAASSAEGQLDMDGTWGDAATSGPRGTRTSIMTGDGGRLDIVVQSQGEGPLSWARDVAIVRRNRSDSGWLSIRLVYMPGLPISAYGWIVTSVFPDPLLLTALREMGFDDMRKLDLATATATPG